MCTCFMSQNSVSVLSVFKKKQNFFFCFFEVSLHTSSNATSGDGSNGYKDC